MVDVPMAKAGQGSGSQSTVRQIGSALGIAVLGTLLFSITTSSVESNLKNVTLPPGLTSSALSSAVVDSAGGVLPSLKGDIQAASASGFTAGVSGSAWAAAGFLALGAISTLGLGSIAERKKKAEKKAQKKA
jgi:hypothetical protein